MAAETWADVARGVRWSDILIGLAVAVTMATALIAGIWWEDRDRHDEDDTTEIL